MYPGASFTDTEHIFLLRAALYFILSFMYFPAKKIYGHIHRKNQRQRILRRFPSYADNLPLDVIELLFDSYTHEKSLNQYQDIDKITGARRQQ